MACISVRVVPSSSRNKIVGWYGKQIKIQVQAPPEGGKANKAVLALISREFGFKRSDIEIVSGKKSMDKVVEVPAISEEELAETLTSMNF
jgi:uncharacterized protein (TIGR00251 family)